ncbi:hypothetical protein LDL08_25510 [Nonomuraea glycinis]|nr:hypothetical protein [Nonomuraea glycinis]MCA2179551.1 hypothetical protein [Nonomuraea glycinis]
MDVRRPSADEVYGRYRRLVSDPELDVAMCWTVVVPGDGADSLTLYEVSARLGGGTGHELHGSAKPNIVNLPLPHPGPRGVMDRSGAAVVLYGLDHLGSSPGALRRLASNARVYSAWWNVNSVNRLSLAVDGEVLVSIDGLFPGNPEDHPNLARWPELAAMSEFFDFEDEDWTGRDDGWSWKAGFLTAIELATGVRLDHRWLDTEHPYLALPDPVPE